MENKGNDNKTDWEDAVKIELPVYIKREFAETVAKKGWDIVQTAVNSAVGPGKHFYPIGKNGEYAILSTNEAILFAYGYKEKVQDVIDRYSEEALQQEDPGKYMENLIKRMIKAIPQMGKFSEKDRFTDDAVDYVYNNPDMILASRTDLTIHLFWEGKDGQYTESATAPKDLI